MLGLDSFLLRVTQWHSEIYERKIIRKIKAID